MSASSDQKPDSATIPNAAISSAAPTTNPDYMGYGMAIGGALLFSTKGIFIKLAYFEGIGAETILAIRMIVAVPIYILILILVLREPAMRQKLSLANIVFAAAVGSLGYYVASYLDFSGLKYVSAQYERLVLFTYPFFTLALGVAFFGDQMRWRVVPALVISWLGLMLIFGWNLTNQPDGLFVGTVLVLAAAVTFALYQHLAKKSMNTLGPRLFTCIGMLAAGGLAIIHNGVQNGIVSPANLGSQVWLYGLALGIVGTILPSFMLSGAIHRIGARATSATGTFGPIMTIFLAVLVLSEPFTIFHLAGSALVVLGGYLFSQSEQSQSKRDKPTGGKSGT